MSSFGKSEHKRETETDRQTEEGGTMPQTERGLAFSAGQVEKQQQQQVQLDEETLVIRLPGGV